MPLAELNAKFEIMKIKFLAMGSSLAEKAAPGIDRLIDSDCYDFQELPELLDGLLRFGCVGYANMSTEELLDEINERGITL